MSEETIEALAKLVHETWCKWSQTISEEENISPSRKMRWNHLWIPYEKLTEESKEMDREFAKKYNDLYLKLQSERCQRCVKNRILYKQHSEEIECLKKKE